MKNKRIFIIFFMFFAFFVFLNINSVKADSSNVTITPSAGWSDWFSQLKNRGYSEYFDTNKYYQIYGAANTPNASYTAYLVFVDKNDYDSQNTKTYLVYKDDRYYLNYSHSVRSVEFWNGGLSPYCGLDYRDGTTCGFVTGGHTDSDGNPTFEFGSTIPLIYRDVNYDSFFFKAPHQNLKQVLMVERVEANTLGEVLHLLPLIIVVMVSFLGLRKGLTTLLNLVKTA